VGGGRGEGGTERAAEEPLAAGELAAVSLEAASMCPPSWGRADVDVVTAFAEETVLDGGILFVEGMLLDEEKVVVSESVAPSLEQSRSEWCWGRIWLAAGC